MGIDSGQCLSEWVRIAQLVRAVTGVLMVIKPTLGGDRFWPVFAQMGQDSSVGQSCDRCSDGYQTNPRWG